MTEENPKLNIPEDSANKESKESAETLPVVSTQSPLKLIRMDMQQAFFQDAEGKNWYMDVEKHLWREMSVMDLHPMALQFTTPLEIDKSQFDTIEDAINYTQRLYFEEEGKDSLRDADYYKNDNEMEPKEKEAAIAFFMEYGERCKAIADLMKEHEEAEGADKKTILRGQIKSKIEELNKFNSLE